VKRKKLIPILMGIMGLLMVCKSVRADNDCLEYEPVTVEVVGTLKEEVFPGRPNFESIAQGDEPEDCLILHLDKTICVKGKKNDPYYPPHSIVDKLHLALTIEDSTEKLINKKVAVKGNLFSAHTAHHHTTVLLQVSEIRLLKR
jgi:hypothetical protein